MSVEPGICPICSRMPCHVISMGPIHLKAGCRHLAVNGSRSTRVRVYLQKMHGREVHVVLGRGVCSQLPDCMERIIEISFPNEDGSDCAGLAKAGKRE